MSIESPDILAPYDGSGSSKRALALAARLATGLGGRVIVYYVYPATGSELMGLVALDTAEIERATQTAAQRTLDAAREFLEAQGCAYELKSALGDPAREIMMAADQLDVSLIVMGSRGLSDFRQLLLGSVSSKVLHHAHCPVTVVR